MPTVPAFLLKKLYVKGSLKSTAEGSGFSIKNTLAPGTITGIPSVGIDGEEIPVENITIGRQGSPRPAKEITPRAPFGFRLNDEVEIWLAGVNLQAGTHALTLTVATKEVGELKIAIEDRL